MTTEETRKLIDDTRVEQLTEQLCHHWQVASQRLAVLADELQAGMNTPADAELYAALIRMQSSVMALMELNKLPCFYLFSEYSDRIGQVLADGGIRQSVISLFSQLFNLEAERQESFFNLVIQSMAQHIKLPAEQQKAIQQQADPMTQILTLLPTLLKADDLLMVVQLMQEIKMEGSAINQEKTAGYIEQTRKSMDQLAAQMAENRQAMLIWLMVLILLPQVLLSFMQQRRTERKSMASIFNKVLARVRKSDGWADYWQDRRKTLRVVSDSSSWSDIMTEERSRERAELGKVPGALFAKWCTDREAFEEDFLSAALSDDDLRRFIFHLAALAEIARELNPTTKFGDEQLTDNEHQQVGNAVLEAAQKLDGLVDKKWYPHYHQLWQELVQDDVIFQQLKVTRRSPHNNLFTACFFCHLVGELKKSAVFGAHSDNDLAAKLVDSRSVGTFRKNIQEGLSEEDEKVKAAFAAIFGKYKQLVFKK